MARIDKKCKLLIVLFSIILFNSAFSQSGFRITGKIVDTTEKTILVNANIVLLAAKDSLLVTSVRSNMEGKFELVDTYRIRAAKSLTDSCWIYFAKILN